MSKATKRKPKTADERILRDLLTMLAKAVEQGNPKCPNHSIYRYVLLHGQFWTPQPLPAGFHRGIPKTCFQQSQALAKQRKLQYVEGYALPGVGVGLAVLHGWCVDGDGRVVDITWEKPGLAYCGVVLDLKLVKAQLKGTGLTSALDNYKRDFPLLRKDTTEVGR